MAPLRERPCAGGGRCPAGITFEAAKDNCLTLDRGSDAARGGYACRAAIVEGSAAV